MMKSLGMMTIFLPKGNITQGCHKYFPSKNWQTILIGSDGGLLASGGNVLVAVNL
jgi:hypothetical protein